MIDIVVIFLPIPGACRCAGDKASWRWGLGSLESVSPLRVFPVFAFVILKFTGGLGLRVLADRTGQVGRTLRVPGALGC